MKARWHAKVLAATICATALAALGGVPVAQAAFDDPIFVFRPVPPPPNKLPKTPLPPDNEIEGPCGTVVDEEGNFLVSDYYHDEIDIFSPNHEVAGPQITEVEPLDGPCGLAMDADGSLYVNAFHRNVLKYDPSHTSATVFAGVGTVDGTYPTGVAVDRASGNVYVDQRDRIGVLSPAGVLIKQLGVGTLEDGYGAAFSESSGDVYVADAGSDTVKVYDPAAAAGAPPVAEIDGSATPLGHFVALRDSALAVDRASGDVYVTDDLTPQNTERHESVVYVFDGTGAYLGRLKYSLENSIPIGIAVDNSARSTQGRVYVTSGYSERAAVYAYRPGSATTNAVPIPPLVPSPPGAVESAATTSVSPAAGPAAATAAVGETAAGAPAAKKATAARKHRKSHHARRAGGRRARR